MYRVKVVEVVNSEAAFDEVFIGSERKFWDRTMKTPKSN
jgi:hypothetical protein